MLKKLHNLLELLPYFCQQGLSPLIQRARLLGAPHQANESDIDTSLSYSQSKQDLWLVQYFNSIGVNSGKVLEIGANDGVTFSNSLLLEKFGFTTICVEPNPDIFQELKSNRTCLALNCGIGIEDGNLNFLQVVGDKQATMLSGFEKYLTRERLDDLREKEQSGKIQINKIEVELCSVERFVEKNEISHLAALLIDTEGGELPVVKRFLEIGVDIKVICIENNSCHYKISYELSKHGFKLAAIRGGDELYSKLP